MNTPDDRIYIDETRTRTLECIILHTSMKCVTMDENKSRVFSIFDRTAVGVVEDDILSNGQSGHLGSSKLLEYFTCQDNKISYRLGCGSV